MNVETINPRSDGLMNSRFGKRIFFREKAAPKWISSLHWIKFHCMIFTVGTRPQLVNLLRNFELKFNSLPSEDFTWGLEKFSVQNRHVINIWATNIYNLSEMWAESPPNTYFLSLFLQRILCNPIYRVYILTFILLNYDFYKNGVEFWWKNVN